MSTDYEARIAKALDGLLERDEFWIVEGGTDDRINWSAVAAKIERALRAAANEHPNSGYNVDAGIELGIEELEKPD